MWEKVVVTSVTIPAFGWKDCLNHEKSQSGHQGLGLNNYRAGKHVQFHPILLTNASHITATINEAFLYWGVLVVGKLNATE
jgi:hypothetical protein